MNKIFITLAIFAVFLTPHVLSSDLKGSENRELGSINLGNLGNLIGNAIANSKNNTKPANTTIPTTPSTPATNTTTPTTPSTPSTPVTNTPTPTTPSTPVVNDTTPSTPVVNDTTPSTPSTPTTNTTTPVTPAPSNWYARNDVDMSAFKQKCLDIHNILRAAVGVANVTWSDSLAQSAQAWAENMAVNGFRHSGRTGENIASTTYSTKVTVRLLGLWTKEQDWFIKGCTYPKCSSTGAEVGHYTQMVWAKTTQVGCGYAPGVNKQWNYLCCQYYRAGNVIGQTVYPYPIPTN